MKNEFGEEISQKQLEDFVDRIRDLDDREIDRLWTEIGFVVSDHADDLKALRWKDIQNIRENRESAKIVIGNLLFETPVKKFRSKLKEIED